MKYRIYSFLERTLRGLERLSGSLAERFAICPECGQNRYTGKPCQNITRADVRTWNH